MNKTGTGEDLGTPNFESVAGSSRTDLLAVGWGGVYRSSIEGWAYEAIDGNPRLNHIWYNGSQAVGVSPVCSANLGVSKRRPR